MNERKKRTIEWRKGLHSIGEGDTTKELNLQISRDITGAHSQYNTLRCDMILVSPNYIDLQNHQLQ